MARSLKKGPFVDHKLLQKVMKQKETGDKSPIKTWARGSQVDPNMVGHRLSIHNGRTFVEVFITEAMVGHRIGEFAPSRLFRTHGSVTKRTMDKT